MSRVSNSPRWPWRAASIAAAVALTGVASGCPDADPTPAPAFALAGSHPEAAFLSAGGTGPDDVWVVGAQSGPQDEPIALHYDGTAWEAVATGVMHDLWWAHAFEGGPTLLAGAGGTVLRVTGGPGAYEVERTDTPPFFGHTVYGVWGASPDDVWAVGGFAGRAGFLWHFDGDTWTDVALPDDLPRGFTGEIPALFKVWGRGADDVWVVGSVGTVLHYDGASWQVVPTETTDILFTVTGDEDEVVIVGGSASGVVMRGGLEGFVTDTPEGSPLLQGVTIARGGDGDGTLWVAGQAGLAWRQPAGGAWESVDLGFEPAPDSVHALWFDGEADVWAAGGAVLTPQLNLGVVTASAETPEAWAPEPVTPEPATCPDALVDPEPDATIARRWMEQLLNSVRRDIPHPPVHARNLLHTTIALFDTWVAYGGGATPVAVAEPAMAGSPEDVDVAMSYAALRVLQHRYAEAIGGDVSLDCYARFMAALGLDPDDTRTEGADPVAVGNRIGEAVIARYAADGANEANGYEDTTGWEPTNPVMIVDLVGTNVDDPDIWQQLNLGTAETQNGIVLDTSVQPYIGPQWREVEPFAITRFDDTGLYSTLEGGPPRVDDPAIADMVLEVLAHQADMDIDDGVDIDIGPASRGDNPLGTNDGVGHSVNPATGQPYEPNVVPRGDYGRVVAEIWADGPSSETPPGHWMTLAIGVADALGDDALVPFGVGEAVDRLAYELGLFLAVSGATHDAAVSAWELKRETLGARPITVVRWMAGNGQRTDPSDASYHEHGLPLQPGLVEIITPESSAPGERHFHLRWHVGEIAVRGWPGEPGDRSEDHTPIQWLRALDWIPYQRRTFVTPAFPGFTSGHSTFSRAAAEALTAYTGSPYFPGGYGEYEATQDAYLVFENGPTVDVRLQWATYQDAADEAGQSRIWGGIHLSADDYVGRINGERVGKVAAAKARQHVLGEAEDIAEAE